MNDLQTAMELTPAEIDAVSGGFNIVIKHVTLRNFLNHDAIIVALNSMLKKFRVRVS
jgi:hypothetical protein